AHPRALLAPDLWQREAAVELVSETGVVHVQDDLFTQLRMADKMGLMQESVGFASFTAPLRIAAHPVLANPHDIAAIICQCAYGSVGDRYARAQHQYREIGDRNRCSTNVCCGLYRQVCLVDDGVLKIQVAETTPTTGQFM